MLQDGVVERGVEGDRDSRELRGFSWKVVVSLRKRGAYEIIHCVEREAINKCCEAGLKS